ncbi:hypothetical protein [Streptomyces sp. CA-179760]|uniref:hypothetical protein n=1 Tax=Streptomyces sp. CA-179760 TaxID=3240054 RepID=UPI003D8BA964
MAGQPFRHALHELLEVARHNQHDSRLVSYSPYQRITVPELAVGFSSMRAR